MGSLIGNVETAQILGLFADGMNSSDISRELNIGEDLVKLVLSAQNGTAVTADRDITEEQLKLLRNRCYNLAFSEDDTVSLRACMFLIERDKPKTANVIGSNITILNQAILTAREGFNKMKEVYSAAQDPQKPVPHNSNGEVS